MHSTPSPFGRRCSACPTTPPSRPPTRARIVSPRGRVRRRAGLRRPRRLRPPRHQAASPARLGRAAPRLAHRLPGLRALTRRAIPAAPRLPQPAPPHGDVPHRPPPRLARVRPAAPRKRPLRPLLRGHDPRVARALDVRLPRAHAAPDRCHRRSRVRRPQHRQPDTRTAGRSAPTSCTRPSSARSSPPSARPTSAPR